MYVILFVLVVECHRDCCCWFVLVTVGVGATVGMADGENVGDGVGNPYPNLVADCPLLCVFDPLLLLLTSLLHASTQKKQCMFYHLPMGIVITISPISTWAMTSGFEITSMILTWCQI